jgi:hypothetical protein
MTKLNTGNIPNRILSVATKGSGDLLKINLEYEIRDTVKTRLVQQR